MLLTINTLYDHLNFATVEMSMIVDIKYCIKTRPDGAPKYVACHVIIKVFAKMFGHYSLPAHMLITSARAS